MINKKAQTLSAGMVIALFLLVIAILFFLGGGGGVILDIVKFLKNIPTWGWVILIILFIFRRWGK
jgi:hypothetical protein